MDIYDRIAHDPHNFDDTLYDIFNERDVNKKRVAYQALRFSLTRTANIPALYDMEPGPVEKFVNLVVQDKNPDTRVTGYFEISNTLLSGPVAWHIGARQMDRDLRHYAKAVSHEPDPYTRLSAYDNIGRLCADVNITSILAKQPGSFGIGKLFDMVEGDPDEYARVSGYNAIAMTLLDEQFVALHETEDLIEAMDRLHAAQLRENALQDKNRRVLDNAFVEAIHAPDLSKRLFAANKMFLNHEGVVNYNGQLVPKLYR